MGTLGPYLTERALTAFKTSVEVDVAVKADMTRHADDREFRHDKQITDPEIKAVLIQALDQVVQAVLDGRAKENNAFVITDPSQEWLNVVCTFEMRIGAPDVFTIITVMRERDFHVKPGDVHITL